MAEDHIGYQWLAQRYGVEYAQPLPVKSKIGTTRRTRDENGTRTDVYTANMRPDDTLAAHLTFALKHEGTPLEFLSRLFAAVPEAEIAHWVNSERTGQYARRVGFLWEWMNGRELVGVPPVTAGNYVDAIDADDYMTRTAPTNSPRWRVRDNLPGTRDFCPVVRRTSAVREAERYNCAAQLDALQAEYGTDILMRSAVWLTVKESRASFQIEHEENRKDKIQRFAAVMEARCGELDNPLDPGMLAQLQTEVIGERSTLASFGLRRSPVFVGETSSYREVVHYVAPHWEQIGAMLRGLEAFVARTKGASLIARAAVAAFGFVYIHPLADGNGRIHRFLINDMLRRDGAVPRPFILPVSATIMDKPQSRAQYDTALEAFSKPFMALYRGRYEFQGKMREYDDKIKSNFVFMAYDAALPAWRYPDLTAHVEYLAALLDRTLREEMRNEAKLMRARDRARAAVKEIVEGPNSDIDRIIRSVQGSNGQVSGKLAKEFPILDDPTLAGEVVHAIEDAFAVEEASMPHRRATDADGMSMS